MKKSLPFILLVVLSMSAAAKTNKYDERIPSPLSPQLLLFFDCIYEPFFLGQKMLPTRELIVFDSANQAMKTAMVDTAAFTRFGLALITSAIQDFPDSAGQWRYLEAYGGSYRTKNWNIPPEDMEFTEEKWQYFPSLGMFARSPKSGIYDDVEPYKCELLDGIESFEAIVNGLE